MFARKREGTGRSEKQYEPLAAVSENGQFIIHLMNLQTRCQNI